MTRNGRRKGIRHLLVKNIGGVIHHQQIRSRYLRDSLRSEQADHPERKRTLYYLQLRGLPEYIQDGLRSFAHQISDQTGIISLTGESLYAFLGNHIHRYFDDKTDAEYKNQIGRSNDWFADLVEQCHPN
jgi:hypothetical protein